MHAPRSASTSRPESSASTHVPRIAPSWLVSPSHCASETAFFAALPANVSASSTGTGAAGNSWSSGRQWNPGPRMAAISPTLCALRVAMSSVVMPRGYNDCRTR
jgi:hypothetical protein